MKSVLNSGDLSKKKVLVRVDWNVPIKDGVVTDDYRIRASLPTLEYLSRQHAKIIIISHLEPETESLRPIFEHARTLFPFTFIEDSNAVLLENLRHNPGEKGNDEAFARELASRADIFVNEAFSASHREHASIVGVPKFIPSFAGIQFAKEVEKLSKAFNPPHPFLLILGGAKSDTKLTLVEKFLNIADEIFIAGALAKPASEMPFVKSEKVTLPVGDIAALDADEDNLNLLAEKIGKAEFIVWNGPLGKYEDGYTQGTRELAEILARSGKEVMVGGGDTLAVIKELELLPKFSFVSTGGGAMLDFLAKGTLPGIQAFGEK